MLHEAEGGPCGLARCGRRLPVPAGGPNPVLRLEAYPEYEVTDYELRAEGCGFQPDVPITSGSARRPVGVHFRVLEWIGAAWNAFGPTSPVERLAPPPRKQGSVTQADAGASDDAGSP